MYPKFSKMQPYYKSIYLFRTLLRVVHQIRKSCHQSQCHLGMWIIPINDTFTNYAFTAVTFIIILCVGGNHLIPLLPASVVHLNIYILKYTFYYKLLSFYFSCIIKLEYYNEFLIKQIGNINYDFHFQLAKGAI